MEKNNITIRETVSMKEIEVFYKALSRTSSDVTMDNQIVVDWYNGVRYEFDENGKLISSYRI